MSPTPAQSASSPAASAPGDRSDPRFVRIAVALLVIAVVAAFSGSLQNGFVDWDDDANLIRNDAYKGLSLTHLRWMFTTNHAGHYHPLTWLSHAVDHAIWGEPDPFGSHLTNLLLHLLTTLALFQLARRLIGRAVPDVGASAALVGALIAAMLYGVHPLRVESVAWATERRDVLSGAWLMAALLMYVRAALGPAQRRDRRLALCMACYVLSLLSKAWGITLPFVLLALDVYPLRRIGPWTDVERAESARRVLIEKAVFLIPALAAAVLAGWAQSSIGAMRTLEQHPLPLRIAQAAYGIVFYLGKTIWPYPIYPLYEKPPGASATDPAYLLSGALVIFVTFLLIRFRRRVPGLLVAWIVYVVVLSPVLGIAQSGPQVAADRYTYLAVMPLFVLIGGGIARAWGRGGSPTSARRRTIATAVALALCMALILRTRDQVRLWADSETLWRYVLAHAPDTALAHSNYAVLLNNLGESERALRHAQRSIEIYPANPSAHSALARALFDLGRNEEAEREYRISLEIDPGKVNRMIALAMVLTKLARYDEAERLYREVIEREPEAAEHRFNLGGLLASRDRWAEAERLFDEAIELDPDYVAAYFRAGVSRRDRGDHAGAVAIWREGLARAPRDNQICAALAHLLATSPIESLHDGGEALRLARIAVEDSQGRNLRAREALAAALARTGAYGAAIETAEALLAVDDPPLSDPMRRRVERALAAYRSGRAFVDGGDPADEGRGDDGGADGG